MDESEAVYGSEADIREFVERSIEALGGDVEKAGNNLFRAELPARLRQSHGEEYGPFTFSRDFAIDHDGIDYLSPDDDLVQRLMQQVLDSERGDVGLKLLPFVDEPGITYNYRVKFEDGTGEVIREDMIPVFVDAQQKDPRQRVGQRIVEGDSVKGSPDAGRIQSLLQSQGELRTAADRYISQRIASLRDELHARRREETRQELDDLEAYADAERDRIQEFIEDYERKAEAGSNMNIAIRSQQDRLNKLEQRIEDRREELKRKEQVISLAPDVENLCFVLPV